MPLPAGDSCMVEFVALLTKEALAEAVPLVCGVKVTVMLALLPAATLNGKDCPLRANSEVPVAPEETITLDPVALSVAVMLLLCPTTTLPKLKVPGLMVSWPAIAPLPDIEIARFGFEAFDTTAMFPLTLPAEVGAKMAPKVKLCPGISVNGKVSPVTLNPGPVTLACVTVRLEPPELVSVSESV